MIKISLGINETALGSLEQQCFSIQHIEYRQQGHKDIVFAFLIVHLNICLG